MDINILSLSMYCAEMQKVASSGPLDNIKKHSPGNVPPLGECITFDMAGWQ